MLQKNLTSLLKFMDRYLLSIIACPICNSELIYDKASQELICKFDKLAYPIQDGIPILLECEARGLHPKETNL